MKTKIINWFRTQHFHTHPALESHSHYISCLNMLECLFDKPLCEQINENENWKEILGVINQLTEEQLEKLDYKIHSK